MISGSFESTWPFASCGSTATYTGVPSASRDSVKSKRPRVAVAKYGAIGSLSRQTHVVLPPAVPRDRSTPFAITVNPSGTVTEKSNVALSLGVSLTGYHAGEPCGSPTTNAPSSVGTQPSIDSSGSLTTDGVPA